LKTVLALIIFRLLPYRDLKEDEPNHQKNISDIGKTVPKSLQESHCTFQIRKYSIKGRFPRSSQEIIL